MFNPKKKRLVLILTMGSLFLTSLLRADNTQTLPEVTVKGVNTEQKSPFLPDVQGTRINAGKKTYNVKLKEMPTVTNNNYRQALIKTPGLLLSEETTPLVSIGYRGLNPDRAQFIQVMKDGIPIVADMFGYPEAYYTPLLQTVDHIEFLHGGSALMFGPQPGGALNYVTKKPVTDRKILASAENVFGSDNYFSTYESLSGTLGPVGYQSYIHERQGDGFRRFNSDFEVIATGMKITINQTGASRLTLNYEEYHEQHGEPGGLSLSPSSNPTYEQDRNFVTREFDRFRLERYFTSLIFEHEFSETSQFDLRAYTGHYRRWSKRQRGGGFGTLPTGAASNSNDIQEQDFYNVGIEPRLRHDYEMFGETHTFTFGTHAYFSHAPREEQRGFSPLADTGTVRKSSDRDTQYLSLFMENLFRWEKLSVTPGIRVENLWQRINEHTNLDKTVTALVDDKTFSSVPLLGIGAVYELLNGIEAYTNWSQSYRPKTFTDAVPLGANQVVSGDLEEGHAWQSDVGLRGQPVPFANWDVNYFILDFKGQTGTEADTIKNVGDSRHHGIELGAEMDLVGAYDHFQQTQWVNRFGSVTPFATATFLDAEFYKGPNKGRQPQYAPKYNLRTGAFYSWRDRVKLGMTSTFLGDHFADDASTLNRKVPSYKVWDLSGEVKVLKNVLGVMDVSLFGAVNNLFDENYYARITSTGIDPGYLRNMNVGFKISAGNPLPKFRGTGTEAGTDPAAHPGVY